MDGHQHISDFPRSLATLAILAGGSSRRLGGYPKFLLPWGEQGRPVISHVLETLSPDFTASIVSTSQGHHPAFGVASVVLDKPPGHGPLGGLASSLEAAQTPYVFALACDMPLVNKMLVRHLLEHAISQNLDVVVPTSGDKVHALHAVYHRRLLPIIRNRLREGQLRMEKLLDCVSTHYVEESTLRQIDPYLRSLSNINTFQDLRRCREIYQADQESAPCS